MLASQINYTRTNVADHTERFSHDAVKRYLAGEQLIPKLVWEKVKAQVSLSQQGCLLFDDTVIDKRHSFASELVRRQWRGNAKRVITGMGVVTCV